MFSLHSKTHSSAVITAPNKLSFLLAKALFFALEWKAQDELSICQHGPHSHHHLKQVWFSLNRSVFLHGIMGNLPFKIHPTQLELPRRHLKKKKNHHPDSKSLQEQQRLLTSRSLPTAALRSP